MGYLRFYLDFIFNLEKPQGAIFNEMYQPALPRNSNWRLDFPGTTQEETWIPHRNSKIPPQLEENHVVPPSSQDEALASYSVSGEAPRSILKFKTIIGNLDVTTKVPRHPGLTRGEHQGSVHRLFWAPYPLLITTGGSITLLCLEGVPDLPGAPQDEAGLTRKFKT